MASFVKDFLITNDINNVLEDPAVDVIAYRTLSQSKGDN